MEKAYAAIKGVNISAKRKIEHSYLAQEMEKAFEKCYELTKDENLNPDFYFGLEDYKKMAYNSKNYTKKEIDSAARRCLMHLQWEYREIMQDMKKGTVHTRM